MAEVVKETGWKIRKGGPRKKEGRSQERTKKGKTMEEGGKETGEENKKGKDKREGDGSSENGKKWNLKKGNFPRVIFLRLETVTQCTVCSIVRSVGRKKEGEGEGMGGVRGDFVI